MCKRLLYIVGLSVALLLAGCKQLGFFALRWSAPSSSGGTALPAFSISGISPPGGALGGGTNVTITGTGFVSGTTVSIGGANCGALAVVSAIQITCTTSANAGGLDNVVVTRPDASTVTLTA